MSDLFRLVALWILTLGVSYWAAAEPLAQQRFEVDGRPAFLIVPPQQAAEDDTEAKNPDAEHTAGKATDQAAGKPWVWYAPTLLPKLPSPQERWMFDRLLAKGVAIAGIDVGESFGNPKGRASFQKLYVEMTERRGFSKTPVLLARSRGGLMLYNWAAEHPDCVGAVAGIYPVCNLASWPGLNRAARAYEMSAVQLEAELHKHNPIDRLAPLAKAGVPIFHLHGDADRVVPLEGNTAILAERYRVLGGPITVEVIAGGGHDLNRHWFESETLLGFMIEKALADPDNR